MGCFQFAGVGKSRSANVAVGFSNDTQARNIEAEVLTPDPDLGWRHVPGSLVASNTAGVAFGTVHSNLTNWVASDLSSTVNRKITKDNKNNLLNYPQGWIVHFFNNRSGHLCHVSLITLALNICVRAQRLAISFGVLVDSSLSLNNGQTEATEQPELAETEVKGRRRIYVAIGIPDFGWELIRRADNTSIGSGFSEHSAQTSTKKLSSPPSPQVGFQMLRTGNGKEIMADVPAIGMNIAEQLHRLERKQDSRHFLPNETFGWQPTNPIAVEGYQICVSSYVNYPHKVISAGGTAVWSVPEEMIMNVTQWVQQTYLTSAIF